MNYFMTEPEKAYIAGIVDGEGCIRVNKTDKETRKNPSYNINCHIVNTNKEVLEYIQSIIYCGKIFIHPKLGKRKILYKLSIDSCNIQDFIKTIYPYLRIKRKQAEIAFRFFNLTIGRRAGKQVLKDNILQQEILYEEMKNLNK